MRRSKNGPARSRIESDDARNLQILNAAFGMARPRNAWRYAYSSIQSGPYGARHLHQKTNVRAKVEVSLNRQVTTEDRSDGQWRPYVFYSEYSGRIPMGRKVR